MVNPKNGADNEAFRELAVPLLGPLYNFARWLSRDTHEAEDLVQETFARALKAFASFQPGTNFRAWMFRILRNQFITQRSGKKTMVSVDDEEGDTLLPPVRETPESALMGVRTRQQIQVALERLPENYREVVLLCDVEEMKYQEIAELLDIPVGTVMSRIGRGRKLLRGMLAEARLGR